MSGPKYFWQLYQFVKSKTLGVTVLRKKKGGTGTTHSYRIQM